MLPADLAARLEAAGLPTDWEGLRALIPQRVIDDMAIFDPGAYEGPTFHEAMALWLLRQREASARAE